MPRRRVLIIAATVAVAAVVVLALPDRQAGEPAAGVDVREAPATGAPGTARTAAPSLEGTAIPGAAVTPGGPTEAVPPHDTGGVTGAETPAPAAVRAAVEAAVRFAQRWADPAAGWHARLAPLATPALAAQLADADPPEPAAGLSRPGVVEFAAPDWLRVRVSGGDGDLLLDLTRTGDEWRVSAVDWRPS